MPDYQIETIDNGAFVSVIRCHDGASLWLQGEDAVRFCEELGETTDVFVDDDVCRQYDEAFSVAA